jgi:hypothetical protein
MNYFPGLASNQDPPDLCSSVAQLTRVSHQRPAKRLYFLNHTSSPFCSGYFGNRVSLLPRTSDFRLPAVTGMTGAHLVEMGSHEIFAWAGLKL